MTDKLKQIQCDPVCGFMVRSHDENEVLELALMHAKKVHPDIEWTMDDAREKMEEM